MSRTDKTDPWWVKKNRYGIEHHNHENGVCDGVDNVTSNGWWSVDCGKTFADSWRGEYYNYCVGPMPKDARRHDRKQRRAADRKAMQDALYDPEGWEDTVPLNHRHGVYGGGWWD